MITIEQLEKSIKENNINFIDTLYKADITEGFYNLGLDFTFDLDYLESSSDSYIQATVYIKNILLGEGFTIILDNDVRTIYKTQAEFINYMMHLQLRAGDMIRHFEKENK